ncbi:MAG TPA: prepilin-type N-terminal cleavage/methylation domain-containing protein [Candidatus Acidoferrum sp.]|nr:prepilin-type N-terminal cleavage/methylation domain-containing protein [Candidatus Acidoferrum sp.]
MKKQTGFTLVELMVAIAVSLVVLAAALATFSDTVRTNQVLSLRGDMTDNLRAGLNYIQQDLLQAGTGIPTGGIPIPNTPNGAGTCNIGQPLNRPTLQGALTFPACNFSLPAVEPGMDLGPQVTSPDVAPGPNSDLVTVLYADNALSLDKDPINRAASPGVAACNGTISATGDSVTFDPSATCHNLALASVPVQPGDLIMFSNAQGNAVQTVTAVAGAQTLKFAKNDSFNLNGRNDPQGTIVQLQNLDPVTNKPNGFYPPTTATRIWMISYYLDNIADPLHVRLIRRVNFQPGQAVGDTLENLQFTYNFVDGVTNPSGQQTIPAGLSESQIRAINVSLWARSPRIWARSGHYLRDSLSTQVSLRSMAFVNKYN